MGTHQTEFLGRPAAAGLTVHCCCFIRVRNPDPEPKPLYWWTNIAAPEEPGVRVLARRLQAWRTEYDGSITGVDIPFADAATDVSYPLPAQRAADYFFQVPSEARPWIAAVQADGCGLIQTSTAQLCGRKLFCWGTATGGRRREEWLCGPGARYLEIQAGLATTQLEHLRMEARAEISWARPTRRSGLLPVRDAFLVGRGRRGRRAPGPSGSRRGAQRMALVVASRDGRPGTAADGGRLRRWRG